VVLIFDKEGNLTDRDDMGADIETFVKDALGGMGIKGTGVIRAITAPESPQPWPDAGEPGE
jgi:hypothetical protein